MIELLFFCAANVKLFFNNSTKKIFFLLDPPIILKKKPNFRTEPIDSKKRGVTKMETPLAFINFKYYCAYQTAVPRSTVGAFVLEVRSVKGVGKRFGINVLKAFGFGVKTGKPVLL